MRDTVMGRGGVFSELEYLVLALIGGGKTSGYAIRKELNRTKGGRWSAESGSVYRVLRRLELAGFVEESGRVGVKNRERTEYRLTGEGNESLDSWLSTQPSREEFAFLVDPMRTRSYFLGRLSLEERVEVVERWLAQSETFCQGLEKELAETAFGDRIKDAGYANLIFLARARHEWLKTLQTVVAMESEKYPEPNE
ncbi:PadR family transcriptional regulator [bacterium]|nr:MAG: PadR family transcriptional regulator [bacterium]